MGTKLNPGTFDCYANAQPDEPMFVLLARDPLAADLVREWATRRTARGGANINKIAEALDCANAMTYWHNKNVDQNEFKRVETRRCSQKFDDDRQRRIYAAAALTGILGNGWIDADSVTVDAFDYADAMLLEQHKRESSHTTDSETPVVKYSLSTETSGAVNGETR